MLQFRPTSPLPPVSQPVASAQVLQPQQTFVPVLRSRPGQQDLQQLRRPQQIKNQLGPQPQLIVSNLHFEYKALAPV